MLWHRHCTASSHYKSLYDHLQRPQKTQHELQQRTRNHIKNPSRQTRDFKFQVQYFIMGHAF